MSKILTLKDHWNNLIVPYEKMNHHENEHGWVVWRVGTGLNVELLHIQVHAKSYRKGHGRRLLISMLESLRLDAPHSIFGFTESNNHRAIAFYKAMGFLLTAIPAVYPGGAILFSQEYRELCNLHTIDLRK